MKNHILTIIIIVNFTPVYSQLFIGFDYTYENSFSYYSKDISTSGITHYYILYDDGFFDKVNIKSISKANVKHFKEYLPYDLIQYPDSCLNIDESSIKELNSGNVLIGVSDSIINCNFFEVSEPNDILSTTLKALNLKPKDSIDYSVLCHQFDDTSGNSYLVLNMTLYATDESVANYIHVLKNQKTIFLKELF